MPAAPRLEERAGRLLGLAAIVWIALLGCWGISGTFPEGHYASAAAIGTAAANMWRLHIWFPVPYVLNTPVSSANYYMHHPIGLFWLTALLVKVLGTGNWVLRAPAIAVTVLSAIFVYRTARALWGPLEAGLSALAYVALPIVMGFANYLDLEGPVTLGCLFATWGYIRLIQTSRARYGWASVLGMAYALGNDWETVIWLAFFVALVFVWAYVVPDRGRRLDYRVFGRYFSTLLGGAVVVLLFSFALIVISGRMNDIFNAYGTRSSGNQVPLRQVLEARHVRIELMFTPIAIAIGKIALPVIIARAILTRNHFELLPLPLLAMAVIYYVHFKNGADTHIFWPRPFSGYFPLAVGALAISMRQAMVWAARLLAQRGVRTDVRRVAALAPWLTFAVLGLALLLVFRDGASLIRLARESGGRFMEVNSESEVDRAVSLRWFLSRYPANEAIGFHPAMRVAWSVQWEIGAHPAVSHAALSLSPPAVPRLLHLETRWVATADLREAARRFHVIAVGPRWFINRAEPPAPIDGYQLVEKEPGPIDWMLNGGVEPTFSIEPDPFVTWEMRTAVGQAAPAPTVPPKTFEQLRVAHNVALTEGKKADAAAMRARLMATLERPVHARYDGGTNLLGAHLHKGAARSLTLLFEAGTIKTQARYAVVAEVTGRRWFSSLPVDPSKLDVATSPPVPTDMWKPGHLYAVKIVYRKRAGHERFSGVWINGPRRIDGPPEVELLRF